MTAIQTGHPLPGRQTLTVAVGFIALGALAVRVARLDAESLWMDELVTVQTYYLGPAGVVRAAAIEGQPPLDNFIGAALARVGLAESDWWVRFPAAVFGASAVFLLGIWIGRMAGSCAGVGAATLLALCPLHVAMSQEVRPYALTFLLALTTAVFYARGRRINTRFAWGLFGGVLFLFLMTRWTDPHFAICGIVLHALASRFLNRLDARGKDRESSVFRQAAVAIGLAYLAYAPFFWVVLAHSRRAIQGRWSGMMDRVRSQLVESFTALFSGYSVRTVFAPLPATSWIVSLAAFLGVVGIAALLRKSKRSEENRLFVAVFLPFPFLYSLVYACAANAIPKPQYLLPAAILVFGAIGAGLQVVFDFAARRRRVLGLMAVVVPAMALCLPMAKATWEGLQRIDKRDWRGAMGYLKTHAHPGDVAATVGSDTVPPTFAPIGYGKARYGAEFLKFVPIALATTLDTFDQEPWRSRDNTAWLLVYTDRMYLGFDQVPPPTALPGNMELQAFHGLFLLGILGDTPAVDRLMDGIATLYTDLPDGRSLVAPAMLRARWFQAHGDAAAARADFELAVQQCRSDAEIRSLPSSITLARRGP